jgi:hypothetical protein
MGEMEEEHPVKPSQPARLVVLRLKANDVI